MLYHLAAVNNISILPNLTWRRGMETVLDADGMLWTHMTANAKGLQLRTMTFLAILGISIVSTRNRLTKVGAVLIIKKTE